MRFPTDVIPQDQRMLMAWAKETWFFYATEADEGRFIIMHEGVLLSCQN